MLVSTGLALDAWAGEPVGSRKHDRALDVRRIQISNQAFGRLGFGHSVAFPAQVVKKARSRRTHEMLVVIDHRHRHAL